MGSSSSSYAPKTIYLDVDGKVQRVSLKISNIKSCMFKMRCILIENAIANLLLDMSGYHPNIQLT